MAMMAMMCFASVSSLALINYTGNWTVVSFFQSAVMIVVVERGVGMWREVFGLLVISGYVWTLLRSIRHQRGFKCIAGIRSGGVL